jgi:hypothetical protein
MKMQSRGLVALAALLLSFGAARACSDYVGMNIADGIAEYDSGGTLIGTWPHSQLWNPAGSGKVVKVSRLRVAVTTWNAQTPLGAHAVDMVAQSVAMPTENGNIQCKTIGATFDAAAETRVGHLATNQVTGVKPFFEIWPSPLYKGQRTSGAGTETFTIGSAENDKEYVFDPPIEILPGNGVSVRSALPAMFVVTSWQWQEVSQ